MWVRHLDYIGLLQINLWVRHPALHDLGVTIIDDPSALLADTSHLNAPIFNNCLNHMGFFKTMRQLNAN